MPTRTVVWTAAVKPNPVIAGLRLLLTDQGRIDTDSRLQVKGMAQRLGDRRRDRDPHLARKVSRALAMVQMRSARAASSIGTERVQAQKKKKIAGWFVFDPITVDRVA